MVVYLYKDVPYTEGVVLSLLQAAPCGITQRLLSRECLGRPLPQHLCPCVPIAWSVFLALPVPLCQRATALILL